LAGEIYIITKNDEAMIKASIIFILLFLYSLNLFSQSKTNSKDIFKMHLFLDKINISRSDLDKKIVKNDSLYDIFKANVNLEIEELKLVSNLFIPKNGDFKFYILKDVFYKDDITKDDLWFIKINLSLDCKYVIAVNEYTGRNYRLSGFNNNDFFAFFYNIKESYKSVNFKKLRNSIFFKKYNVEYLDFECLYKGLKQDCIDKHKFPCLKSCSDAFSLHQFNKK
jgi:hypothetical protein